MIRMTHPTIGTHVDVPESTVEAWTAQGWLRPEPEPVDDEPEQVDDDVPAGLAAGSVYVAIPPRTKTPRDDVR